MINMKSEFIGGEVGIVRIQDTKGMRDSFG